MGQRIVEATGLRKRFGDIEAVKGVSFWIEAGETYGLLGPNGAGKTTTISMVAGLLERDGGDVVVAGQMIDPSVTAPRATIGLVPQELAIYPDLTGRENLRFFGKLYGMGGKTLERRVEEVLDVIGLTERADDHADDYSGGMKRRLNIGIGLLHEPSLLILDEPTVGVDPQSRNAILESVEALSAEGRAVLYTTHYMEEAERLCDRVAILDEGEIKAEGTRSELVGLVGERDRIRMEGTGVTEGLIAAFQDLAGMAEVRIADHIVEVFVTDAASLLPDVLRRAADGGMAVSRVEVVEPDLEAVFLHLTGKALRD